MQRRAGIQMPVCENRPPDDRTRPPFVRRTIATSRGFKSPVGARSMISFQVYNAPVRCSITRMYLRILLLAVYPFGLGGYVLANTARAFRPYEAVLQIEIRQKDSGRTIPARIYVTDA